MFYLLLEDEKWTFPCDIAQTALKNSIVLAASIAGQNGKPMEQLTCISCRINTQNPNTKLLAVVPILQNSVTVYGDPVRALAFIDAIRDSFPSTVRKSIRYSDDSDDEHEDKRDETSLKQVPLFEEAHTKVGQMMVFNAIQEFMKDFPLEATTQKVLENDYAGSSFVCIYYDSLAPAPTPQKNYTPPNNFAVVFSNQMRQHSNRLVLPTHAAPVEKLDSFVWDHTIITAGTERIPGKHGGGKTPDEMLDDMRRRHASGSFCRIIPQTSSWPSVVEKHFPELCARLDTSMELRLRKIVGPNENEDLTIQLSK